MAFEWFKIMLSIRSGRRPSAGPTTKVVKFHLVAGAAVYGVFAVLLLCGPELLHYVLRVKLGDRSTPYVRLLGIEVIVVAFNYLIIARSNQTSRHGDGRILASVPERLILMNLIFIVLTATNKLPLALGLLAIALDSILGVLTFIIWYKTTHSATVEVSVKETLKPLTEKYKVKGKKPSLVVHVFGFIKFVVGFVFSVRPELAQAAFGLKEFKDNSGGYLGAFFGNVSRSAWHKIYMGKVGSLSFSIGNVFSHFAVKIPLLIILVATKQIEVGIFAFVGGIDLVFGAVVLVFLCIRGLKHDDDDDDEEDETDHILPPKNKDKEQAVTNE